VVRTLTLYKKIIEELGLRQLDVYRVRDEKAGGFKDIIRVFDPATSKVYLVDLGKIREAVKPVEFLEAVIKASEGAGVRLPERIVARLREKFKEEKPAEEAS